MCDRCEATRSAPGEVEPGRSPRASAPPPSSTVGVRPTLRPVGGPPGSRIPAGARPTFSPRPSSAPLASSAARASSAPTPAPPRASSVPRASSAPTPASPPLRAPSLAPPRVPSFPGHPSTPALARDQVRTAAPKLELAEPGPSAPVIEIDDLVEEDTSEVELLVTGDFEPLPLDKPKP